MPSPNYNQVKYIQEIALKHFLKGVQNKLSFFFSLPQDTPQTKVITQTSNDLKSRVLSTYSKSEKIECNESQENIDYKDLCSVLNFIETTTKRIAITDKLADFFVSVIERNPKDLVPCIYLCLGCIAPSYEGKELGVGEGLLLKSISISTGCTVKSLKHQLSTLGDLGAVAQNSRVTQMTIFKAKGLTVRNIFKILNEITASEGSLSQTKKINLINGALSACSPLESRYFVRVIEGKMRVGLAEKTVLRALARAALIIGKISDPEEIQKCTDNVLCAFSQVPSFDHIANLLVHGKIKNILDECKILAGIPVRPMLSFPAKNISEIFDRHGKSEFLCEYKYDGERIQIHMDLNNKASLFSRNMENLCKKYPDVIEIAHKIAKDSVNSFVLDGEVVAWDPVKNKVLPFQVLSTRKRKDTNINNLGTCICLFVFDLLYINGESVTELPHTERRDLLMKNFNTIPGKFVFAEGIITSSADSVKSFLEKAISEGHEGIIVKCLDKDTVYKPTVRTRSWLKLKKDYLENMSDTFDLVPIGAYKGHGKRTNFFGGYLLAVYDTEKCEYQTVCKIGTGFSDKDLEELQTELVKNTISSPKPYYVWSRAPSLTPDVWFDAVQVWEVKAADISLSPVHKAGLGVFDESKGISLRFPRFIRVREDRDPTDATSTDQLTEMYQNQFKRAPEELAPED